MSGGWWGLIVAIILGLVINECGEVSPWLADKIVTWAARIRWPDSVEEKRRHVIDRPGKLFKLITACGLGVAALSHLLGRRRQQPHLALAARFRIGLASALLAGGLAASAPFIAAAIADGGGFLYMRTAVQWAVIGGAWAFVGSIVEFLSASRLSTVLATSGFTSLGAAVYLLLGSREFDAGQLAVGIVLTACLAIAARIGGIKVVKRGKPIKPSLLFVLVVAILLPLGGLGGGWLAIVIALAACMAAAAGAGALTVDKLGKPIKPGLLFTLVATIGPVTLAAVMPWAHELPSFIQGAVSAFVYLMVVGAAIGCGPRMRQAMSNDAVSARQYQCS